MTTTEKIASYLSTTDGGLLQLGDWVFPDVHVSVKAAGSAQSLADAMRDGSNTLAMAKLIAIRQDRGGRPVLLKMVTYPMGGVSRASLAEQAAFFVGILENRRDAMTEMPAEVAISVHSAFDSPWKTNWPFYEWDRHTGLLESNGVCRPAAKVITGRLP